MPIFEPVSVEAYAGWSYPGHPRAVTWRGRRYAVEIVEREWLTPAGVFFAVRCDAGPRLTLCYEESIHRWQAKVSIDVSALWMGAGASIVRSPGVQED
jgi:hypothetical protein